MARRERVPTQPAAAPQRQGRPAQQDRQGQPAAAAAQGATAAHSGCACACPMLSSCVKGFQVPASQPDSPWDRAVSRAHRRPLPLLLSPAQCPVSWPSIIQRGSSQRGSSQHVRV